MGVFELVAKILGFDVGDEPVPRDIVSGDEAAEEDFEPRLIDELEDASVEPKAPEPGEEPSVLSQESQDRIKDLLRQLGGRRR